MRSYSAQPSRLVIVPKIGAFFIGKQQKLQSSGPLFSGWSVSRYNPSRRTIGFAIGSRSSYCGMLPAHIGAQPVHMQDFLRREPTIAVVSHGACLVGDVPVEGRKFAVNQRSAQNPHQFARAVRRASIIRTSTAAFAKPHQ